MTKTFLPHQGQFPFSKAAGLCLAGLLAGCVAVQPPKVVHEDRALSVRLMTDGRAGVPHGHPAHVTAAQMARILSGLRVVKYGSSPLESRLQDTLQDETRSVDHREGIAAFSRDEIRIMTPHLVKALDEAQPNQLVTFHLKAGQLDDPTSRPIVTSGGLFVQEERMYVVLANFRTKGFGDPLEGSIISEMDIRSDPLVPIMRGGYALAFSPNTARLQLASAARSWEYVEEQKIVVIDLGKMTAKGLE